MNVLAQNMSSSVRSQPEFVINSWCNELLCLSCAAADPVVAETQAVCQYWCQQLIRVVNPDPQEVH